MRIAFLAAGSLSNPKESSRITLLLLAKELQKQGHQVILIARKRPSLPPEESVEGVRILRSSLLTFPRTVRQLEKEGHWDIIHGFSAAPLFALISFGCSQVTEKAQCIHSLKSSPRELWKKGGEVFLNLMSKVTVPTQVQASGLKWVQKKKVSVLPSVIDTQKFRPRNQGKLKKKYGYENKKIIFYYGALWKNKGFDLLLESLPRLHETNFLLLCAPRYHQISEQQQRARQLGISNQVLFLTQDVAIEEYVAMADVVVLPYRSLAGTEGNPSCLLEAMASKTPVVTTDLPELREIAEGCILMAQPGDVASLVDQISQALQKYPTELMETAYQKSQEFSVERVSKQVLELYQPYPLHLAD